MFVSGTSTNQLEGEGSVSVQEGIIDINGGGTTT